jgi:hypothetical protein
LSAWSRRGLALPWPRRMLGVIRIERFGPHRLADREGLRYSRVFSRNRSASRLAFSRCVFQPRLAAALRFFRARSLSCTSSSAVRLGRDAGRSPLCAAPARSPQVSEPARRSPGPAACRARKAVRSARGPCAAARSAGSAVPPHRRASAAARRSPPVPGSSEAAAAFGGIARAGCCAPCRVPYDVCRLLAPTQLDECPRRPWPDWISRVVGYEAFLIVAAHADGQ